MFNVDGEIPTSERETNGLITGMIESNMIVILHIIFSNKIIVYN